jgi:hypothetical protein
VCCSINWRKNLQLIRDDINALPPGVSDRAKQLLVGAGLETIGHLVDYRAARGNFTGIKGIGPETDEDIKAAVEPHMPGAAEAAEHVDGE